MPERAETAVAQGQPGRRPIWARTGIVRVGATLPSRDPEASALASSARQARGECDTQPGQPLACTAREATEAATRPLSNPGTDDLRSPGR